MQVALVVEKAYIAGVAPVALEEFFRGLRVLVVALDREGSADTDFAFPSGRLILSMG